MDDDTRGQFGAFYVLLVGVVALVVLTLLLLLGMQLVGAIATGLGDVEAAHNKTASPDPITGQAVSFEDTTGPSRVITVWRVNDSTGYGVELTGAPDSYWQSDGAVDLATDDTWSLSTWARVDDDAGDENLTALSANGRALIQFNGSAGEWVGWYYDAGSGDSYRLTAAANQPGNLSLVTFTSNGTHLKLYRNTTLAATQSHSVSAVEDAEFNATNWDGTLDETRVFDDATNDSEQATLYNNPVAPRPNRSRTARLMFDEGSGATTPIYFAGTDASLNNASWTAGLDGHVLTSGADYTLDQSRGEITALDGGRIDGAPVVWIDYRYEGSSDVGVVGQQIGGAFALFGTAVVVIPAVAILAALVGGVVLAVKWAGGSRDFGSGGR